ncbi:MAG: OmpA family protein [Polyangiaceae bacterium]|nr:OmpA family protein [Polyangiaceae bacterium]MBK8943461.1 OmpA family protein [Polyangiaceae bacterium]
MTVRSVKWLPLLAAFALGCGYSEDEWQMQLSKYRDLQSSSEAAQKKLSDELKAERDKVAQLAAELEKAGVNIGELKSTLSDTGSKLDKMTLTVAEQQRALIEYQAKAKQLELIKARFETLRKKLDALTKLGLAVNIRNNRMVISLPGDVLFDSGKETLKKEGKEILAKVANVIKNDPSLFGRYYQVAGHTDNKPYAGTFRDNWGLSLMRSREVLLFLVNDKAAGMPPAKWSAAGFGDTDPVANNDLDEGRQKNRRSEIIVVPSVEEMLDLKTIAQ